MDTSKLIFRDGLVQGERILVTGSYLGGGGNFSQLLGWDDDEWNAAKDAIKGQNQKDRAKRAV